MTAATTQNDARQPIAAAAKASGAVASKVPMVPTPICSPASIAKRSAEKRCA